MTKPRRLKRTQERDFSAHHSLLHVAQLELATAESTELGRFNHCLVAMTFSALALEALANAIGDRIVEDWKDYEALNPFAKVRFLAEHLRLPFIPTQEPYSTARYLVRFRNLIAHAKPERVVEELLITEEQHESRLFDRPLSKLEREVTVGNAKRCVEAVDRLKVVLGQELSPEDRLGITTDGWSGSTEPYHDA